MLRRSKHSHHNAFECDIHLIRVAIESFVQILREREAREKREREAASLGITVGTPEPKPK